MAKKALDTLTETMFYVLMALNKQNMCGSEITAFVKTLTEERVIMGPGTLYSILSYFQKEELIEETDRKGRMVIYSITEKGKEIYVREYERLRKCVLDAEKSRGGKMG